MILHSLKELIKTFESFEKSYIFGTGTYGELYGRYFEKTGVIFEGYIDNNVQKQGTYLHGRKILSLKSADIENACIFIATAIATSVIIKKQLLENGVSEENIIEFNDDRINDELFYNLIGNDILKKNIHLKDMYKGKRGVIIGNGPSLTKEVLNKVKGEISFACNFAIEMVGINGWVPSWYVINDSDYSREVLHSELTSVDGKYQTGILMNARCLSNEGHKFDLNRPDLWFYHNKGRRSDGEYTVECDMMKPILDIATTVHAMLQIMIYMGFKEIYMVGMDWKFPNIELEDGTIVHIGDFAVHSEMQPQDINGSGYSLKVSLGEKGFKIIREYADQHDVKIYNITPDSGLNIFEKKDIESVEFNI